MPEAPPTLPARQRLQLKIMLPMSIGILIFLGLYILSTSWYLEGEIERNLNLKIVDISSSFQNMLDQRTEIMRAQLKQLTQSQELQLLMQQKDRNGLFAATQPTFSFFRDHLKITHYYFHNPDQTVFLRVYDPSRFGDRINRQTLQKAVTTQKVASGIELGTLGTFTLRTVHPWYRGGELLGYIELGEEIELLINNFFQRENTALTLTIDKQYLDREKWEAGIEMLGKETSNWNLLPNKVIVQTSIPEMLPGVLKLLQNKEPATSHSINLEFNNKQYRGQVQPLLESSGRHVGDFLILMDVSAALTDYWNTVTSFTILYLLATGGFLFFTMTILGNTEAQLKTTDQLLLAEMTKVHESNTQLTTEIDERKAAEAELQKIHDKLEERVKERTEQLWLSLEQTGQARKQLTDIISSVTDALLVTDLNGKLQLLNPSAAKLFQCQAQRSLGQPLKTIVKDAAVYEKFEDTLLLQFSGQRIEFTQISENLHKPIFLQARTSIITDKTDQPVGMIFLIHDISHEREMERMKSEFISTAVHELSTPLTAVMGYSELLLSEEIFLPEEELEFITIINEKSEFLSRLVGDILDVSRIESGKPLEFHREEHGVAELFERPIHHFRHFSPNHPFEVKIRDPGFPLRVDRQKIWQVMENLCSNAVKYSPAGGKVTVTGEVIDDEYQVTITDPGLGMTLDQTTRVFEKFYRCNQSDTSVGGTGLGMTIVKSIIDAHDGQIWLVSELGQGTSVHFTLPT